MLNPNMLSALCMRVMGDDFPPYSGCEFGSLQSASDSHDKHKVQLKYGVKIYFKSRYSRIQGQGAKAKSCLLKAGKDGSDISVILGAHNIQVPEESQQKIDVRDQIIHHNYNASIHSNDVMILKLRKNAKVNRYVLPLYPIESGKNLKPGDLCNVAGWGRMNNGKLATKLQEADLKLVSPEICAKYYPKMNTKELICAGDPKENKYSYGGDSGGPLFCKQYLHGIVLGGRPGGGAPRLFTSVSSYIPWINDVLKRESYKEDIEQASNMGKDNMNSN
ncbi:granzyme B(G,H)-like [Rhinophrynus dorsalis]